MSNPEQPKSNFDTQAKLMVVSMNQKNVAAAFFLTLFFGGLGMMYTSIMGGLIFFAVEIILLIVAVVISIVTMGFGTIVCVPFFMLLHLLAAIFTLTSARAHNQRLLDDALGK